MGILRLLAAAVVLIVGALSATAQMASQAGPLGQPIPRRTLSVYAAKLTLTPEQRDAVRTLYDGYWSEYTQARDRGDQAAASLYKERAPEAPRVTQRERGAPMLEFIASAERLEKAFFDDLRALLTSEQDSRFEQVQRHRRRETGLRFPFAYGSQLDLVAIADTLKTPRNDTVVAALNEWEIELDRLLIQRTLTMRKVMERVFTGETEEPSPEVIEESVGAMFTDSFRIRDLSRRFVREIVQSLDENARIAFEREVEHRSYPKIYETIACQKLGAAIAARMDLDPDQREAALAEVALCEREIGEINARITKLATQKQDALPGNFMKAIASGMRPEEGDELVRLLEERTQADRRWQDRLPKVLSDAQRASLPIEETTGLSYQEVIGTMPDADDARLDVGAEDESPE